MSASDLLSELKMSVSETQGKKLMKGQSIQLHPSQVGVGPVAIKLDSKKVKKILRATQKGKGIRMTLSPHEMQMNGEGLFDWIKKGAQWLKDNNLIRPLLKAGVKNVLPLAAGVFGGPAAATAVSSVADKYGDSVVDKAGDVLGFGMKGKGKGAKGKSRKVAAPAPKPKAPATTPRAPRVTALDNMSNFIIPSAPASHPPVPSVPDQSLSRVFPKGMSESGMLKVEGAGARRMRGKSFKLAGSSFKLAGSSFK